MKKMKVMAVLAVLFVSALFMGAASAAVTQENISIITAVPSAPSVDEGVLVSITLNATATLDDDVYLSWGDGTSYDTIDETNWDTTNFTWVVSHTYALPNAGGYPVIVSNNTNFAAPDAMKEVARITVNSTIPPTTQPTGIPVVPRDVTSGGNAFVFEYITVAGNTGSAQTLMKFTDGMNPVSVNDFTSDGNGVFHLTEENVRENYGVYYLTTSWNPNAPNVSIHYPNITLKVELTTDDFGGSNGDSINNQNVNKDTVVSFLISAPRVGQAYANIPEGPATAKIVFTTPVAGKTTDFGTAHFDSVPLIADDITLAGFTEAGPNAAAGTYTAQAEYVNPAWFRDYAKKSNTISFTLQSPTLTITAAKDAVVRSNPFTVTITGKALTDYRVFLENAADNEVNPTLQPNQSGLVANTNIVLSNSVIGAVFKTDASGKRTIQYNTASSTEEKTYTIRVEALDRSEYDTAKVKVEKGSVTITASGDGSYFIGTDITLSGTNTDSSNVFLFITGPNLNANGIVLRDLPLQNDTFNANSSVAVRTDNTWEYKWDTSQCALDTGAYTIYATSRLTNGKASNQAVSFSPLSEGYNATTGLGTAVRLSDSEYATISVHLKQPFVSAIPSGSVVAQGDTLYVSGTAGGEPTNLMLYIFGQNFFEDYTITVEGDGSYERKIDITMDTGQYFVVVQHPMYNGAFDALLDDTNANNQFFYIRNETTGGVSAHAPFVVWGANKLQGSQAADALTKMIDSQNIDDTYTKFTFNVEMPWIRIVNPGDKAVGDKFTITGTTNLAVDDQILVEVASSSFTVSDKTQTNANSGISQTTKVVKGDGADNVWSITDVDTANWKLDEYVIKVNGIEVGVTSTTNFDLVEKIEPTPTETGTGTTPTTVPPTTPTTPPTPGFGAFVALAGLGAVALLVLRRN